MDEDYEDFLDFGRLIGPILGQAKTESGREKRQSVLTTVDHNFVETMKLELIGGRDFSLDSGRQG